MMMVELLEQPAYKAFLLSTEPLRQLRSTLTKMGVDATRARELLEVAKAVVEGDVVFDDVPELVEQAFECSSEAAREIARDVIGYRLLPLSNVVPGVEEALRELGGDPGSYPGLSVYRDPRSALAWAQELVEELQLTFSDVLLKRLALLLEQRSKGEKTPEELATFFGRPLSIGGLALEKGVIDILVTKIEEEAQQYRLVSEDEWRKIVAEQTPVDDDDPWAEAAEDDNDDVEEEAEEAPESSEVPTTDLEIAPSHELATSVPVINSPAFREPEEAPTEEDALKARVARQSAQSVAAVFAEAVDAMTEDIAKVFAGKSGVDRRAVVSLLSSGLRGAKEEKSIIEQLKERHNFTSAEVDMALVALAKGKRVFARATVDAPKLTEDAVAAVEETEMRLLDRRFANPSPVSAPKLARVELTVGSVPPKTTGRLTDVAPGKRLMGPVEQLGAMTPQDFRRLGTTPEAGVQKIEELLQSLSTTGVEEHIRGVKAFRESPLMRLYATIAREALLKRVSVAEAAAARRKAGEESLGPQEVKAILGLQGSLAA